MIQWLNSLPGYAAGSIGIAAGVVVVVGVLMILVVVGGHQK